MKTFSDKAYWTSYYARLNGDQRFIQPSHFAQCLAEQNLIQGKRIIELGCGNGRDSVHFARNGAAVTAIDQCKNAGKLLFDLPNITFFAKDFTRLEPMNPTERYDVVYSRFTMHSIDYEGENRVLSWAFHNLVPGGYLCVEARTLKDELAGKGLYKGQNTWFYGNHHRRFIDVADFKEKLASIGFELLLFAESKGFATCPLEDPVIMRVIAHKTH